MDKIAVGAMCRAPGTERLGKVIAIDKDFVRLRYEHPTREGETPTVTIGLYQKHLLTVAEGKGNEVENSKLPTKDTKGTKKE